MNQHLKSLWLTETVRLVEKDHGRFQDEEANRQARVKQGTLAERIILRAEVLSQQNGLQKAQHDWLSSAKVAIIILLFISVFTGVGLAFSALAQNPVNLYWALLCLLGLHLVTLILWLISAIFLPNDSGSFFIHIWLWLTRKLSQKSTISQLLPAFISLFGKQIRWLVGLVVNLLWSVILLTALIVLVALLSTKHYSFEWQTTLLSTDTVVAITHLLGSIPALLGFSLPDAEMIRSSEQAIANGVVRSAWAVWLLGVFIVYGIAIRFVLLVVCWLKWNVGCRQIVLNMQYPEYQLLSHDLQPISTKSIVDEDNGATNTTTVFYPSATSLGTQSVLVAIDIDEHWLPPNNVDFISFLNNSTQREQILDLLQQHPAQKLLIAIDTDRAPDRGMINLITLLMSKAVQCKLWFINEGRQLDNWLESTKQLNIETADTAWLLE